MFTQGVTLVRETRVMGRAVRVPEQRWTVVIHRTEIDDANITHHEQLIKMGLDLAGLRQHVTVLYQRGLAGYDTLRMASSDWHYRGKIVGRVGDVFLDSFALEARRA